MLRLGGSDRHSIAVVCGGALGGVHRHETVQRRDGDKARHPGKGFSPFSMKD